jgi:hypothetical protein
MLLKTTSNINKKFLSNFFNKNNTFFIFNVNNSTEISFIYKYFCGNILHSKQLVNFYIKNLPINLFSGNFYFCFVESNKIFNSFLDLYYLNLKKLNLIGICYNNIFLNININYLNLFNFLYLKIFIIFFICLLFINVFFLKIFLLIKKLSVLKKC